MSTSTHHFVTDFSDVDKEELQLTQNTVQTTLTDTEEAEPVVSAYVANNADVFPNVLDLHVDDNSTIADVTYGTGVFWKHVNLTQYTVFASDINPDKSPSGHPVDCRTLPYETNTLDAVVLDPPYAAGFFRESENTFGSTGSHTAYGDRYASTDTGTTEKTGHEAVLDLYFSAGREATRVLRPGGTLIVKVKDEVSANTQHLTHIQVTNFYETKLDLTPKDLFVVVQPNTPTVSGMQTQVHARKNHSYFLVFKLSER